MKSLATLFVMVMVMGAALSAPRPAKFTFVPLPGGATEASAISDNGNWIASTEGFVWSGFSLAATCPGIIVTKVNNQGLVLGIKRDTWEDVTLSPATSWNATAATGVSLIDVNNNGVMVGHTTADWRTTPVKVLTDGTVYRYTGFPDYSDKYGILAVTDQEYTMWYHTQDYSRIDETYILANDGSKVSLGSDVYPTDMSSGLHVIGTCTRDGIFRNFRWDPRCGMIALKSFGHGAEMNGVNRYGTVVGTANKLDGQPVGVVWFIPEVYPQGIDLNTILTNSGDYKVIAANGISDQGYIAASGMDCNGNKLAGILVPVY